jgi:hypothetical protein
MRRNQPALLRVEPGPAADEQEPQIGLWQASDEPTVRVVVVGWTRGR